MAIPTGTFQRPDLGQYFQSLDLAALRQGFVGTVIAKPYPVPYVSGNFSKIRAQDLLQKRETLRLPTGGYPVSDWNWVQDNWACFEYGAEERLDRRDRKQYAYTGVMQELVAAERARDAVLRSMEIRWSDILFSTSVSDSESVSMGTAAVTNAWTDTVNGTPLADLKDAINAFIDQCGMLPNTIVMNDVVMRSFKQSANVTDLLKFSGLDDPSMIGPSTLVDYFSDSGIKQCLVASGRYNSADQNLTPVFSKIWSTDKVGLFRAPETMDLREPCIARSMLFTGDGAAEGGTIEQYPWEPNRSDVIRCRIDIDEKLINAAFGYILTNANDGTA